MLLVQKDHIEGRRGRLDIILIVAGCAADDVANKHVGSTVQALEGTK